MNTPLNISVANVRNYAAGKKIPRRVIVLKPAAPACAPVELAPLVQVQQPRRRREYRNYHGRLACEYCPYRTEHRSNLVAHHRTHTGERPFRCEVCSMSFCQKGNLKLHMRRHTAEPEVQCPVCPRRFAQKYGLYRHIQQNHPNHTQH